MAQSTYLELCNATRRGVGDTGSAITQVTGLTGDHERIAEWVAVADVETQSRWLDWDFLHVSTWSVNTVANTAPVAAPTDIGTWDEESFYLNYTLATNCKLPVLQYKMWRSTYRQGVQTSRKPSNVVIAPDLSLILHSRPDAIYSLSADYWARPVKMTANGDTSQIPEEYERIIVARAKMMYAENVSAGDIMQSASVEYDDLLDKLEGKYLSSQKRARRMSEGVSIIVRPQ